MNSFCLNNKVFSIESLKVCHQWKRNAPFSRNAAPFWMKVPVEKDCSCQLDLLRFTCARETCIFKVTVYLYIYIIFWMDYHFLWRNAACVWNMPCMLQVQFTTYCFLQKKFCFLTWVCAHPFFVEAVQDTYTYIIYIHLYRHISIFKCIYIYGDSWYFI